jgi:hypothetical protein
MLWTNVPAGELQRLLGVERVENAHPVYAEAGAQAAGRPPVDADPAILPNMLDRLTADSFAPYEGTEFIVDALPGDAIRLRLRSITRFAIQPHAPRPEPFSLEFLGPGTPVPPQSIYSLEHPDMGRLDLFVVPLGPERGGDMVYEIAFN